jgi:hypothetical protein
VSIKFNPLIFGGLDLTGGGPAGAPQWKLPVADESLLPMAGNTPGDARVVLDTDKIYVWDDSTSKWIDTNLTTVAFGSTPNAEGITLSTVDETVSGVDITRSTINLEPADSTNPGAVSTSAQNFAGDKTFDNLVTASSGVETDSIDSITAGAGTLSIGTANASIINIGNSGVNVNLYGNTFYQDVTNLEVTDKQITLNKNGAVDSAFNSGIELEENGSITGYVSTSVDRNSWELKAPNQTGVATIDPGDTGIIINQSSHDPVTLGAVGSSPNINAATLTGGGQVLNLEPADAVNAGLITATAQTFGGDKTFNDDVIVVGNIDAQGGVDSSGASLDIGANSTQINVYAQTDFQGAPVSNVGSLTTSATTTDGVIASLYTNNSPDFSALGFSSNNPGSAELLYSDGGVLSVNASGSLTLDSPDINIGQSPGTTDIIGTVTIEYNPANPTDWAPAPDDVIEGLDQIANRFVSQNQVTKEPTGFPNRDDSVTSFSDTSPARTFTIAPTGVSFDFYVKGTKFTKTTTQSIQIPNLAGNHYIYFNDSGTLSSTQILGSELFENNALVSIVYWNTDTNSRSYFAEERHGLTMDGATHTYLHTVFGARYLSGLALQNFSVDGTGNLAANAQFDADQGRIRDEDLLIEISAQAQIPILYRQGQLWRKKAADAFPIIYSGTAGYTGANGRLPYNQFTGGVWQLTEVANNDFVLVHFFGTNDKDAPIVGIQGTNTYLNVTAARNAASTEITSLSGLPFAEFVAIGSVVFETADGYTNTPKARVRSVNGGDYVDFRGTQLYTPAGNATTHSLLSGLANDDHIQYLLADGSRAMAGALNMGTHNINNVVDPSSAQDAATKNYVDNNVNPVLNYADQQVVYVSKNGNDSTGTGGQHKPFLTIQAALNAITDATASKKYIIRIAPGTYTETLTLKPWVNLQGYNKETVVISIASSTSMTLANRGRLWLEGISFTGAGSININTTGLSGTGGTVLELRTCAVGVTGAQKFTFVGNGPGRDFVQFRNTDATQAINISGAAVTIYDSTLVNGAVLQTGGTVPNSFGELLDGFIKSSYVFNLSVIANTSQFGFFQGFGSTLDGTTTLNGSGLTANFDAVSYPITSSLLNTPSVVRVTKSIAISYDNTTSGLTATNNQAAIDELALNKANRYIGDISRTSFTFADAQLSAANITGLSFSNAVVSGFSLQLTVVRGSSFAEYIINGIQKSSTWEMSQEYVGDDAGVSFSITSAGQLQYVSTSTGSGGTILFRAETV